MTTSIISFSRINEHKCYSCVLILDILPNMNLYIERIKKDALNMASDLKIESRGGVVTL